MIDFFKESKRKRFSTVISIDISLDIFETDEDNAHNEACNIAEQLANYLACARSDYTYEPEITSVTTKEEEDDYE